MEHSKIILVTGGNRGIGFEICRQLDKQNHKVILAARSKEKGQMALKKLSNNVEFIELDMNKPQTFLQAKTLITKKYGRLDVLINNAAIMSSSNGFDQVAMEEIKKVLQTNLLGPIALTNQLLTLLSKSKDGRIINISSGMGAVNDAGSGYAAYRLSKTALNGFSAFLAKDLSETNIKVNTLCPGWVRTDMGGARASRSLEKGAETAIWLATAHSIPNGKFLRDKKVINW